MLDFATQKQLLDPILRDPRNRICADCGGLSPTWASLDFGVLVCSNCSGAHRSLGPTITRVRSASLDKWEKKWIENMLLGNSTINLYWQASSAVAAKKPKSSATLEQISAYIRQKYIKRKYVANPQQPDPLTIYKKEGTIISNVERSEAPQTPSLNRQSYSTPQSQPQAQLQTQQQLNSSTKQTEKKQTQNINLLQFDFISQPQQTNNLPAVPQTQQIQVNEEQEFTDFTQAGSTCEPHKNDLINFDALLASSKQTHVAPTFNSYEGLRAQNLSLHHPYNASIGHHNLVYNHQFQAQSQTVGWGYQGYNSGWQNQWHGQKW